FSRSRRAAVRIVVLLLIGLSTHSLNAQTSSGFIFFGGTISAVNPSSDGTRVQLVMNALTAPMSVLIDENTTLTGSLGGRASTSALTPNLFVEVEGWMGPDGTVRASNIQTKVQTGAIRMYGRIENVIKRTDATSLIVDGVEVRVDAASTCVSNPRG